MKKDLLRLYLDTSVFGGVFDREFELDSKRLMDDLRARKFRVMISSVVLDEISKAPERVQKLVRELLRVSEHDAHLIRS